MVEFIEARLILLYECIQGKRLFVKAAKATETVSLIRSAVYTDPPSSAIVFTSLRPLTNIKQKQEFRWAGGGKFTSPPRRVPE